MGKLGCNEWWGGWGIYSPNHQIWPLGTCLFDGAPDSPVHTGHVRCASHVTPVVRVPTVGALTLGLPGCPVAHRTCTAEVNGIKRHVLGYLQDFLFPPKRAMTPVKALSGGERNRLLLAKLLLLSLIHI